MESKALSIGWKVMLVMGIYVIILGLLWAFGTAGMMAPGFTSATGQAWSDFVAGNPKAADYLIMTGRLSASFGLAIGILVVFVVRNGYRKAEKWSWHALLVVGIIAWGGVLVDQISTGSLMGIGMMTIGVILFLIGLLVPAKAILSGKAEGK